jgi:hypothetical protein
MIQFILSILGYVLLWWACDVNRKEESKVTIFSKWWWLQLFLIGIGSLLIIHNSA